MRKIISLHAVFALLLFVFSPLAIALEADEGDESMQQQQIDINTADAESLASVLEGVGQSKAQEIVAHREMYGKFKALEELQEVRGIGLVTVEKNRHRIKPIISTNN